ncbi:MAG TPA: EAL domain-containing protein, partial [Sulfuricurvum sp.]|nr:EAL domain-containing protein [Sulfuricurvum sp.]
HFIPDTLNIIKEHNLSTDMFEFELTERMLIEDNESGLNRIRKLSDSGFSIAIDDFGTGYSSFSYLQNYIIHTMKIDKSFIDQLEFNQQTRTIVTAMIGLGHHLGMKIVAEGVENAQQYKILKLMNCDILQGYYIDKPLLVKEISSKYY